MPGCDDSRVFPLWQDKHSKLHNKKPLKSLLITSETTKTNSLPRPLFSLFLFFLSFTIVCRVCRGDQGRSLRSQFPLLSIVLPSSEKGFGFSLTFNWTIEDHQSPVASRQSPAVGEFRESRQDDVCSRTTTRKQEGTQAIASNKSSETSRFLLLQEKPLSNLGRRHRETKRERETRETPDVLMPQAQEETSSAR